MTESASASAPGTAPAADHAPADSRDMYAVHAMLRREIAELSEYVANVAPGDRRQVEVVAEHIDFVTRVLHVHHDGEDTLVWPKLAERVPAAAAPVLTAMQADHVGIDRGLTAVTSAAAAWRANPDAARREALVDALRELVPVVDSHLAAEEADALVLIDTYLSAPEWAEVGMHGIAHLRPEQYPLFFGMLLHDLDPELYKVLQATLPPDLFAELAVSGPQEYSRHRRRLATEA
ncbi:hemerythrin domain-containing protein [Streptomyces olivaceus]|uniref:hemerythrin domain-containing protein n=1 Tax=Streptomyces TaxID=1883 RepID=UPI001FB78103|nr:hemerythrin domain-containing protein [Streptomyces sp. CB09030]UOG82816.1 hemerythrin domain-containing protein [Streptomyces sp. CB09030]